MPLKIAAVKGPDVLLHSRCATSPPAASTAPPSGRIRVARATTYPPTSEPATTGAVGTDMTRRLRDARRSIVARRRRVASCDGRLRDPRTGAEGDRREALDRAPAPVRERGAARPP